MNTKVNVADDRVTVTTVDLVTVFRRGDDASAATQIAFLQEEILVLRQLIEEVNDAKATNRD